ncbi:hypothetical protein PUV47_02015 [Pseudovibrio exalbescens]|uniref:hypothetical protein n=1 Tax=Pseudovibrio exalbescens TaxID=197461 RepID=UPI002366E292|nr:hypothetical protein [Pseudovibrio exalbescens]MDD7908680.1 hypothetical protein [Pseudovibrio exalbescens]
MVNYRAQSPGKLREFRGQGQVSAKPGAAVSTNAAADGWSRFASATAGLSNQLGQIAKKQAVHQASEAGLEAGLSARTAVAYQGPEAVVNASLVDKVVGVESGGNTTAKNPRSSATGLGQFIASTWLQEIRRQRPDLAKGKGDDELLALRTDGALSRELAGGYLSSITEQLKAAGHSPTDGDVYLGYFLGPGGAKAVLGASPDEPVVDALSRAVGVKQAQRMLNANPSILPGKTAGEVRGWAAKKMGLKVAQADTSLALRRDGTAAGDAYDRAALSQFSWRLTSDIDGALSQAYEAHKDDPAALREAFEEIESGTLAAFDDPELQALAQKTFAKRRGVYERGADKAAAKALLDEQRADANAALDTGLTALQREAYLAASDPEGQAALETRLASLAGILEQAEATGAVSAVEAQRTRAKMTEVSARAQVRGVADTLESAEERLAYADGLMDAWASGEGPVADLDMDGVRTLSGEIARAARAEISAKKSETNLAAVRMKRLVDSDVASIRETGASVSYGGDALNVDHVSALLSEKDTLKWLAERKQAAAFHDATQSMAQLPEDEVLARVDALEPQAGSPDYESQAALYDDVADAAGDILKLRKNDPALAASEAFPELEQLDKETDRSDPEAMQRLIEARLDAQGAIGLARISQQPLTKREIRQERLLFLNTMLPFLDAKSGLNDDRQSVLQEYAEMMTDRFGAHAARVTEQLSASYNFSESGTRLIGGVASMLARGRVPGMTEVESVADAVEAARAEAAYGNAPTVDEDAGPVKFDSRLQRGVIGLGVAGVTGERSAPQQSTEKESRSLMDSRFMRTGGGVDVPAEQKATDPVAMTTGHVEWLLANPQASQAFDGIFGEGAAADVLGRFDVSQSMGAPVEQGGLTVRGRNGATFIPADELAKEYGRGRR